VTVRRRATLRTTLRTAKPTRIGATDFRVTVERVLVHLLPLGPRHAAIAATATVWHLPAAHLTVRPL
jgi:hypothetical protein